MTRFPRTGLALMAAAGFALVPSPFGTGQASAAPCPDVEVTFARGTTQPPGIGGVGQAFVDSLRSQVPGKSVGVYAVNYPATEDFTASASTGATDANNHVRSMAASCPATRLILGGYSQGALVIDLLAAVRVSIAGFKPAPLPPDAAGARRRNRGVRQPVGQNPGRAAERGQLRVRGQDDRPLQRG